VRIVLKHVMMTVCKSFLNM